MVVQLVGEKPFGQAEVSLGGKDDLPAWRTPEQIALPAAQ
jgi:hypothetical protein